MITDSCFSNEPTSEGEPPQADMSTLNVNLIGTYYGTQLALYHFKHSRSPFDHTKKQLLFISSLSAYGEQALFADYNASKFGVRGIFMALRNRGEVLGGVQINMIAPRTILTADDAVILSDLQG